MAFAYDWYDGTPRISVGGTIATPFLGSIAASEIRVEFFRMRTLRPTDFTSAAQDYLR